MTSFVQHGSLLQRLGVGITAWQNGGRRALDSRDDDFVDEIADQRRAIIKRRTTTTTHPAEVPTGDIAPFDRCPDELVQRIFQWTMGTRCIDLPPLLRVCRRWRAIASDTTTLWPLYWFGLDGRESPSYPRIGLGPFGWASFASVYATTATVVNYATLFSESMERMDTVHWPLVTYLERGDRLLSFVRKVCQCRDARMLDLLLSTPKPPPPIGPIRIAFEPDKALTEVWKRNYIFSMFDGILMQWGRPVDKLLDDMDGALFFLTEWGASRKTVTAISTLFGEAIVARYMDAFTREYINAFHMILVRLVAHIKADVSQSLACARLVLAIAENAPLHYALFPHVALPDEERGTSSQQQQQQSSRSCMAPPYGDAPDTTALTDTWRVRILTGCLYHAIMTMRTLSSKMAPDAVRWIVECMPAAHFGYVALSEPMAKALEGLGGVGSPHPSQASSKLRGLVDVLLLLLDKQLMPPRIDLTAELIAWARFAYESPLHDDDVVVDDDEASYSAKLYDLGGKLRTHMHHIVHPFDVKVRHFTHVITVSVCLSMTVGHLKRLLVAPSGAPPAQQRLIFKGKSLADDALLAHYEIGPNDMMHMVETLRGD